ncbi:MAG: twin-arginine translocase TatA/TatE family subunit [Opitutales bacterium]|nr:twin-arginine translocase TatA/TatE family subunit [Opitutales bacterium]
MPVTHLAFIQNIGPMELIIILVVILLLFGAKRLPELAKGLGKSMSEFKKATQEVQDDFRDAMDSADPSKPVKPAPKQEPERSKETTGSPS